MIAAGNVRVDGLLHEGVRTVVYRATRLVDDKPVILKVLTAAHDNAVQRAKLQRELEVTKAVASPAIVEAYGTTYHDGRLALLLEDFGGASLAPAQESLNGLAEALHIALGIARSLDVIHRRGIVHRDIKPANVIYASGTGQVKITDFGLALGRGERPAAAGIEGTHAYMAPEQAGRLRRTVDRRADLYSYGVLLYELFTGVRPFEARDPLEWMHRHAAEMPRPLTAAAPALPEMLSRIVLKLLAKSPEERYQTAHGAEADLERVRELLDRGGEVAPFRIGENDVSDELRLPEGVYGREREVAALRAALERVAAASITEAVVISGNAGIGKTALARELEPFVIAHRGYSASGKFDQYHEHVPYAAIARAGAELVDELLAASADSLARYRKDLLAALEGSAGVLFELFPDLERVIGLQPPVPELPLHAAKNRLHHAVRAFIGAFRAPLVVFLDDLQWADEGTLDLLETLLDPSARASLLLLLTHRGDLPSGHRLPGILAAAGAAGTRVATVTLGAIDLAAVQSMVHDTIHAEGEAADALAALAWSKTAGNPFFVRELLRTLHLEGLLVFDMARAVWTFDLRAVEAREISDNVVELLLHRLEQLPAALRRALGLAAFLGTELDVRDLAALMGADASDVAEHLRAATTSGLVTFVTQPDGRGVARFSHDRVQQAAYGLTPAAERAALHLQLGRLWWARLGSDSPTARVLEVATHLDRGFERLTDPAEGERALHLFIDAARRAKSANAYAQASAYLSRATALLTSDGWSTRYELTFDVHISLAESDYLGGRLGGAQATFDELLARAQSDIDRARVHYLQIRLFQVAGDLAEAAAVALRSFTLLGLVPPASSEEAGRAVQDEDRIARELLGDRPIASHLDDPLMADARDRILADVLEASGPPIYMVRPELFPWVALQLVNHTLRRGNAEASCYGYGIYALLRAAVFGDVEGGYALSQLAIALNAKLDAVKLEGCMLHLLGDHVNFWKNPVATDLPILERGFAACVRGGDHIYSNYIGFQAPWHLYESGASLGGVMAMTEKYALFARQTSYEAVHCTLRAEQQFIRALMGDTSAKGSLSAADFDEVAVLALMRGARFGCGVVYLHILQLIARYTFGDYAGALEAADAAAPELGSAFSMPIYVSYTFYRGLTLAQLAGAADAPTRARSVEELATHHRSVSGWAAVCPANFADKAALLGAELARVTGDVPTSLRLYEEARLAARSQGFVQYEALACELAARVYADLGVESVRRGLLADAHALYRGWGASAKAADLGMVSRGLASAAGPASNPSSEALARTRTSTSSTSSTSSSDVDLTSVLKAAQSISAEIVLPQLLRRLMSVVIEHVGAQRGWLLLSEGEKLEVVAEAHLEPRRQAVGTVEPASVSALPLSVIQYVERTQHHVLLDDASSQHRFRNDPYFDARHRSVLCKPIMGHGRLVGVFYLENDLLAGAFNPGRLATLDLLAAQTAISIENSRLYQASVAAVAARDEFLSIAAHELRTPLTPLAFQMHRVISGLREGTLKNMPEAALAKMAASCEGQINRLSRLIAALLDVARIGAGKLTVDRRPTDIGALVATTVEEYAAEQARASCTVTLHIEEVLVAACDPVRMAQVVGNLLLNAFKFGRERPVEVTVFRDGEHVAVVVADHGIGIQEQDRSRIFERFERLGSVDNVDGLGLGLYIVRAIVEAHGGRVSVTETPGGGATFDVRLPMAT